MVLKQWNKPSEFACLEALWTKESNWNPKSRNKIPVNGKHAGGIPQILGLSTKLHAHDQINRGLVYITKRYGTPCKAWAFWKLQDQKGTGWY
jgi:hypothetical protein